MEHTKSKFLQALSIVEKNMLHEIYSDPDLDRVNIFSEDFEKSMEKLIKQRRNPCYMLVNTKRKRIILCLFFLVIIFYLLTVKINILGKLVFVLANCLSL